jgi:hypothetical protein
LSPRRWHEPYSVFCFTTKRESTRSPSTDLRHPPKFPMFETEGIQDIDRAAVLDKCGE